MNIHPILLKLARQGDARAIAALMNDALRLQEIWVKATLEGDCLQVMLKCHRPLDQATAIAFIQRGMRRLQAETIRHVRAYSWQTYADFPDWIAECDLAPEVALEVAEVQPVLKEAAAIAPAVEPLESSTEPAIVVSSPLPPPSHKSGVFRLGFVVVLVVMLYVMVTIV